MRTKRKTLSSIPRNYCFALYILILSSIIFAPGAGYNGVSASEFSAEQPETLFLPLIAKYFPPDYIAFYANWWGNNDIYVIDSNGVNWTRITKDGSDDHDPGWSPDGLRIAFASDRLPGNQPVKPDGISGSTGYNVFIMNADGTGIFQLTDKPEGACDAYPDWSPDSKKIAYTSCESGLLKIFTINVDGTGQQQITTGAGWDHAPAWSPDGSRLIFWRYGDDNSDIFVINADGTNQIQLTSTPTDEYDPDWSPDGKYIVYSSYRVDNSDLFIMNADGSGERRLTNTSPAVEFFPAWSSDGQWIAFCNVEPNISMAIEKIRPDGTGRTRLTWMAGLQCEPAWKP